MAVMCATRSDTLRVRAVVKIKWPRTAVWLNIARWKLDFTYSVIPTKLNREEIRRDVSFAAFAQVWFTLYELMSIVTFDYRPEHSICWHRAINCQIITANRTQLLSANAVPNREMCQLWGSVGFGAGVVSAIPCQWRHRYERWVALLISYSSATTNTVIHYVFALDLSWHGLTIQTQRLCPLFSVLKQMINDFRQISETNNDFGNNFCLDLIPQTDSTGRVRVLGLCRRLLDP